jgi:hypothetical protein
MLPDAQRRIEAHVAGQVAEETNGDGKKRYPNEESRRAETFKRLAFHEDYLATVRAELMELESRLELARYEFLSATCLLTLLASTIQANRPDVEQAVLVGTQATLKVAASNGCEQCLQNFAAAANAVANGHPPPRAEEGGARGAAYSTEIDHDYT